jgi:hypothetical protein
VRRAPARHHRHRQHDRTFPLFLRHPRTRRRHRHRARRGRPVRPRRDPVDAVRQHDPQGHRAQAAPAPAQSAGMVRIGHAHRSDRNRPTTQPPPAPSCRCWRSASPPARSPRC